MRSVFTEKKKAGKISPGIIKCTYYFLKLGSSYRAFMWLRKRDSHGGRKLNSAFCLCEN
jgi:hypothetical protein